MDPNRKARMKRCDPNDLLDDRRDLTDVIDFFSDDITAGHIRIGSDRTEHLQVFPEVITRCNLISDDRQRNPPDAGQKTECHAGLLYDLRHDRMHLRKHLRCTVFLYQCRIRDFRIAYAILLIPSGYPEQFILKKCIFSVNRIFHIPLHLIQNLCDIRLRNRRHFLPVKRILCSDAFCKNIPIQINLFQVGENRLAVLHYRQRASDLCNVFQCIFRVV